MQLIGTKEVKGFDLAKHQELTGALTNIDQKNDQAEEDSETLEAVQDSL
jgi:hypothetical protein